MQLIRIGYNHGTGRNLEIWLYFLKKFQLSFSSKIEVPQLGLARAGTFLARARSSQKIPAQTRLYYSGMWFGIFFLDIWDKVKNFFRLSHLQLVN